MDIEKVLKDHRSSCANIGMTAKEFNMLLPWFEADYQQVTQARNPRGAGRKSSIPTCREKLFFVLYYLKNYPTFDVLGSNFGMDRSLACRQAHALSAVLMESLSRAGALPKRSFKSKREFMNAFPDLKVVITDGTERRRRRPKNPEKQKDFYSGKKKAHTIKNLVMTDPFKEVLYVSETVRGKTHDKTLFFE